MWSHVIVLSCLVAVALSAVAQAPLEPKPEKFINVPGCYISDIDNVIPVGASVPCPHHCMQYRCNADSVTIVTCGVAAAAPPCKVVHDHSKPYPDCCAKLECPP